MPTNKELEAQVKQLENILKQAGLIVEQRSNLPEDSPDYIAPGSPEHAQFIGLILLDDQEDADGRIVYSSRQTEQLYCLEDERAALHHCPGMDRKDAVYTILREKVSTFENCEPVIPENAPSMWTPEPISV